MASHLAKLDTVVPLRNQRWQEILCRYNIPGSAISLGHIGYSEMASFGVTRAQPTHTTRPYAHNIDSYTVFEAGSLSKPVVSYLIYTLERQGHLRPNTPLVSQLSRKDQQTALFHELSDELSRSRATRITYEMILTHTAGFDGWRADQPLTINAEPGSRFSYSGEGYLLLQRFLELLLQTDIETIMQQYIFGPIGMPASSFSCPERVALAHGHDSAARVLNKFTASKPVIAGSLHTSLADYTRFVSYLISNKQPLNCYFDWIKRHRMLTVVGNIQWAQGWGLVSHFGHADRPLYWHWGDTGGYNCFTLIDIHSSQFLNYFSNSQNGLEALPELLSQTTLGLHTTTVAAINALIHSVTNTTPGQERYWFDYDQPKAFYDSFCE